MSKITFRADDDLVSRLEALEASKSEVMREALRTHLDSMERESTQADTVDPTIDELVTNRLDQLLAKRESDRPPREPTQKSDITVTVSLEGVTADDVSVDSKREPSDRKTSDHTADSHPQPATTCGQCGETVDDKHVFCPNCGEKASHRLFCECGDEIQSDWGFCPACGRRTPAADVLDNT